MPVQTSSNRKLKQVTDYGVSDASATLGQAGHLAGHLRDPYPSRLSEPLDVPWLDRQEAVVKGRAEDGPLNQAQLDEFNRKGFLFEPDSREIRSLFAVHFLSERFRRLAHDERLMGRARQILGGAAYVHQSRINYKPGFEGKGFSWHSDFETWHAEDGMPAMHAVSASIVLTDNHAFNGPLMLIPGSHKVFVPCLGETPDDHHKQSLKHQAFGVPGRDALRQLVERHGIEAPTGAAGGLLLFDCNTLHGSNANMSPDPRSNIFFVYNRHDNACVGPFAARRRRPSFLAHASDEAWSPER